MSLVTFVLRLARFRKRLQQHSSTLAPGRYRVRPDRAVLVGKEHPDWLDPPSSESGTRGRVKDRLAAALSFSVDGGQRSRRPGGASVTATLALLTRNEHIKFFDLDAALVLSIGQTSASVATAGHSRHLPAPEVRAWAPDEGWWIEDFVDGRPVNAGDLAERDQAVRWLIETHADHVRRSEMHVTNVADPLTATELMERMRVVPEFASLGALLRPLLTRHDLSVARVASHGDACLKNVLKTSNGWILLDWEYAGRYSLLYDACTAALVEVLDQRDDRYVQRFIAGEYDDVVQPLLPSPDVSPGRDRRAAYLAFIVAERVVRRDIGRPRSERRAVAQRYLQTFEAHLGEFGGP